MFKMILKAFGFVHKTEICKAALDIYLEHNNFAGKTEDNYYNIGATGAMWQICEKLDVNLRRAVRKANTKKIKKMYGKNR